MKFIDVADLANSPRQFDVSVPASEVRLETDNVRLLDEVNFTAEAGSNDAAVSLKGRIEYKAEIDCIRCLNPVAHASTIVFDSIYVTPEHFAADKEHEVHGSDLETDVLESDRIDIGEVIRERILLDLPEQIYCREDCKGLCPKCGADRNLIDCKCEENELDPRWSALKDLK